MKSVKIELALLSTKTISMLLVSELGNVVVHSLTILTAILHISFFGFNSSIGWIFGAIAATVEHAENTKFLNRIEDEYCKVLNGKWRYALF